MNKRGWLRIVEASIAIILVLSVLFVLFNRTRELREPDLSERARSILEEIANNGTLRDMILSDDPNKQALLTEVIRNRYITESYLDFEVRICTLKEVCGKSTYTPGNVYAAERVISVVIGKENYNPKKVRLFIWYKQT